MEEEPYFSTEDLTVFIEYGMTMLKVQQFELALKQFAQLHTEIPQGSTFDEAMRSVRKVLISAAGNLTNKLTARGEVPEELLGKLRTITRLRNYLTHDYLLEYVFHKNLRGIDHEEEFTFLHKVTERFQSLEGELSELSEGLLLKRGIDPHKEYLSREELREILFEDEADET
jgi:uncharacterized protein YutE (UPF0331/DUF86 family)